jgi:ABC-type glycerol-3-phosphate transport system substrate-binding protein
MKRLLLAIAMLVAGMGIAKAETIRLLMETVPDTRYIQELLPEFKAQTGIDVEMEVISYIDMHTKLVPQLIASEGSYDAIVVDFYWVGEFTKAGWLMPLDDLVERDGIDLGAYVPKLLDLVGQVEGVTYMLPFYNYSMAVIYREDLLEDAANQAAFKDKYGMDLRVPVTWGTPMATASATCTARSSRRSAATASRCSGRTTCMAMAGVIMTTIGTR